MFSLSTQQKMAWAKDSPPPLRMNYASQEIASLQFVPLGKEAPLKKLKIEAWPVSDLPSELWGMILSYFSFDCKYIFLVNKKFLQLLPSIIPHIKILSFAHSKITDEGFKLISKSIGLEHLNLENCKELSDENLEPISKLKNLKTLKLNACYNITDEGVLKYLGGLADIRLLSFMHNRNITDISIKFLVKQLPKLKLLCLASSMFMKTQIKEIADGITVVTHANGVFSIDRDGITLLLGRY